MPCYQSNQISLDFEAGNLSLLQKAAGVLGLTVVDYGTWRQLLRGGVPIAVLTKDKASCAAQETATINKLRVQYSKEIIRHASLKLGWSMTAKTENKYVLRKGV